MRQRATIVAPATLALALLVSSGCSERPGAGGPTEAGADAETASAEGRAVTPLTWTRIPPEEAVRLGAQAIMLGPSPAPGVTAPPEVEAGTLHHGALHMGGAGGKHGEGTDVFVAVLETPKPEEGGAGRPWLLFVDRDLDGDLREERPVLGAARYESAGGIELSGAQFPTVDILGPLGGIHALLVSAIVTDAGKGRRSAVLKAYTACALSGRARVFGAERDVAIYDADANGVFGDYTRSPERAGDVMWVDFDADGRRAGGETLYLAPRMLHEGRVAAVEVLPALRQAQDAGAVSLSNRGTWELAVVDLDVSFGRIAPAAGDPPENVSVQLFSDEYRLIAPGPADRVPAGTYELVRYTMKRGDIDGSQWLLAGGWLPGAAPRVQVREKETAEVAFGPPVEARAWVRHEPPGLRSGTGGAGREPRGAPPGSVLVIVTLRGSARETVRLGFTVDKKERLADWGSFTVLDGEKEIGTGGLEHHPQWPGAGVGVWVPAEEVEKGKRLALEVSPDVGPFGEGFRGRTEFEYGRSTPIRLVVSGVEPGTQAERVGLRPGDRVLRYDSKPIDGLDDLARAMQGAAGRARVELVVARGGREITFALLPGKIGITTAPRLP